MLRFSVAENNIICTIVRHVFRIRCACSADGSTIVLVGIVAVVGKLGNWQCTRQPQWMEPSVCQTLYLFFWGGQGNCI